MLQCRYFAVFSAMGYAYYQVSQTQPESLFALMIPVTSLIVSFSFWAAEVRNRVSAHENHS